MKSFSIVTLLLVTALSCSSDPGEKHNTEPTSSIKHGIVYYQENKYGGWPANNGIWIWDNEILVGFVEADYKPADGLHTYNQSSAHHKYARSTDGGETWTIEDAYEQGQTAWGNDHSIAADKAETPVALKTPVEDFTDPGFIITFVRHNNNNGPTHFYYSMNKGGVWSGPYSFPDLGTAGIANRTDYIVESDQELSVFLTTAKTNKKEGRVAFAKTTDGGINWEFVSWITDEQEGFDIMPSSLRLSDTELITIIRTRTAERQDLLTAYRSSDNGMSWARLKNPVNDTGNGGSPPALVKLQDGRLALAYIYRSVYGSRVNVRFSSDNGESWSDEVVLRSGDGANRDAGYPRMVQRPDGKLVLIYYWNNANDEDSTPYRYIASTIFDPGKWK
ncbi:MAG TPA: sialidase family protein [Petrimonas sp.]|nr:sialidase family protein [Petrimonas sp.]